MNQKSTWLSLSSDNPALQALRAVRLAAGIEEQLENYCLSIDEYSRHTNLVGNSSVQILLQEHVLDSLRLLPFVVDKGVSLSLIDIGSGAGFPGLVLAIAVPDLHVTLVDSIGKKCRFLEACVSGLDLSSRVEVLQIRAEELAHQPVFREKFDLATARAVAALPVVAELCCPFLKKGGLFLSQRSRKQVESEEDYAQSCVRRFAAELKETIHFEPDLSGRELSLFVFEKTGSTPAAYPRSAAQIKSKPLS